MGGSKLLRFIGISGVLFTLLSIPLDRTSELFAQETDAGEMMRCLEHFAKYRQVPPGAVCSNPPSAIVLRPEEHPDRVIEEALDELMRIAITSDSDVERTEAIGWLALLGRRDNHEPENLRPGIVARLIQVYRRSERLPEDDAHLNQWVVVDLMAHQAEVAPAAKFLEQVARQKPNHRWANTLPERAVEGLQRMGPAGQRSLARLREDPPPREPVARDPSKPVFIHTD